MTRRKVDTAQKLVHKITIRVHDPYYKKLEKWLAQSNCHTISELARSILFKEKINWYHKNAEHEALALELALIRKELNAIGKNINQITRQLHTSTTPAHRILHAMRAAEEYKKVGVKVEQFLILIQPLATSWWQK